VLDLNPPPVPPVAAVLAVSVDVGLGKRRLGGSVLSRRSSTLGATGFWQCHGTSSATRSSAISPKPTSSAAAANRPASRQCRIGNIVKTRIAYLIGIWQRN